MDWVTTTTLLDGLHDPSNRTAWNGFVERFRPAIIGFATKLGLDATSCEDVAQETLLTFSTAYGEGKYTRSRGKLSTWLFGIAKNKALVARKKRQRDASPAWGSSGPSSFLNQVPDDDDQLAALWETEWIDAVMAYCRRVAKSEFGPETYRAFELVALDGLSPKKAAMQLGVEKGMSKTEIDEKIDDLVKTTYNAKHRILKRLRELKPQIEECV